MLRAELYDIDIAAFRSTHKLTIITCMHREELYDIDPFDEGAFCRSRFWLFLSYCMSIASVVLGVFVLLHFYAWNEAGTTIWPGVAVLFQVRSVPWPEIVPGWKRLGSTHMHHRMARSGCAVPGEVCAVA